MEVTKIDYYVLGVIIALFINITFLVIEVAAKNISGRVAKTLGGILTILYISLIIIIILIHNLK